MANIIHDNYANNMLGIGTRIDLDTGVIKGSLVDANDVTITAAMDYYDDISIGVVGTPGTLGTKSITARAFTSAAVAHTAVTGDVCEEYELWEETAGAASTDPLIANYDTFASGMPFTPNGGDFEMSPPAAGWIVL